MDRRKKKVAQRYDRWSKWYDIFDLGGQGKQKQYAVEALDIEEGDRVLDVGCGTGAILGVVEEAVGPRGEVVALDISRKMVELVRNRYGERVIHPVVGDVDSLDFQDNSFQRILATFAITSFPSPLISLKEMYRVLEPGGKMVILDTGKPEKGLLMLHYYLLRPVMRLAGHTHIDRDGPHLASKAGFRLLELKRFKHSLVYCAVFTK